MGICDSADNELIEINKNKNSASNKNNKNNLEKNSSNNTTLDSNPLNNSNKLEKSVKIMTPNSVNLETSLASQNNKTGQKPALHVYNSINLNSMVGQFGQKSVESIQEEMLGIGGKINPNYKPNKSDFVTDEFKDFIQNGIKETNQKPFTEGGSVISDFNSTKKEINNYEVNNGITPFNSVKNKLLMFSSGGSKISDPKSNNNSMKINISNHNSNSVRNPHLYLSKKNLEPVPILDKIPEDMLEEE